MVQLTFMPYMITRNFHVSHDWNHKKLDKIRMQVPDALIFTNTVYSGAFNNYIIGM